MVVDPRRDHSFRVPRPDLSVKLGVPNACTGCHDDRSAEWATRQLKQWYGSGRAASPHFGEALAGARAGDAEARRRLARIAGDGARPAIVRATALATLGRQIDRDGFAAVRDGLRSDDALVRLAAVSALEGLDPRDRFAAAYSLVDDPVRAVRLEATRQLAPVPLEALPPDAAGALGKAFEAFEQSLEQIADRPESLTVLGNFYRDRGNAAKSETTYLEALARHPWFAPAYANLADLYRSLGRDQDGARVLSAGIDAAPENADLHYAYGLLLVRQQRLADATRHLERAAELRPDDPRYSFVYALALQRTGETDVALAILREAHRRHGGNREILFALATMNRDAGNLDDAVRYANALVDMAPDDPRARQLLESLKAARR